MSKRDNQDFSQGHEENLSAKTGRMTKSAGKAHQSLQQPVELMVIPLSGNIRKALFWIGALVFFIVFLVVFSNILLPFVAGLVLAYFLNPVVEFLEAVGFSRLWATVMIVLVAVVALVLGLVILVPILSEQFFGFIKNVPGYFGRLQALVANHDTRWLRAYTGIDMSTLQSSLNSLISQAAELMKTLLPSLWNSGKAVMNMITLLIVAPVVTFYMLLDWDRMVATIDSWIPRSHLETVRSIFRQMNRAIAGFIRGQGTVCLMLGGYYAVLLTIAGLNFGLLIGLFIGLITFIPYIGTAVGFVLAIGLAWVQYWPHNWPWIVVIACIFFIGQFLEGYVLQPKLVGSSVGLHPVWLMFALFAFGSLFGFTGMLLAIPAAAAVGVLVRFALNRYLTSSLYYSPDVPEDCK